MSDPLDITTIRSRHRIADFAQGDAVRLDGAPVCICGQDWECDAVRLCDEVERLRAFETKIMHMLGLPTDDNLINGSGPEPLGILSEWERKGPAQ